MNQNKITRTKDDNGNISYKNENGKFHREDGPALICIDGEKGWYQNGAFHRLDGPAHIWNDSDRDWYIRGNYHRIGGPAIIRKKHWTFHYRNGSKHRLNAPAFVGIHPSYASEWWEFGIKIK